MKHLTEAKKWVEQAQAAEGDQWAQYYCQTAIAHALIAICERLDAMLVGVCEGLDTIAGQMTSPQDVGPPRTERE